MNEWLSRDRSFSVQDTEGTVYTVKVSRMSLRSLSDAAVVPRSVANSFGEGVRQYRWMNCLDEQPPGPWVSITRITQEGLERLNHMLGWEGFGDRFGDSMRYRGVQDNYRVDDDEGNRYELFVQEVVLEARD